jgi:aminoglycoside phosphotransferase (APT) family kinase protein
VTVGAHRETASAAREAVDVVARTGASWFPRLDPQRITVDVVEHHRRARCDLYRLALRDGGREHTVMAKVRHSGPGPGPVAATRPTLMPAVALADADMARLEHDGLRMVAASAAARPGAGWRVARPLAFLPEHATLVMDHVAAQPFRSALMASSRLAVGSGSLPESVWTHTGAWLRRYHGLTPELPPTARNPDRADLLPRFADYARFLGVRTGRSRFLARAAETAAARGEEVLPDRFPMVVGHGDFAVRNLFVGPDGEVTVIDPMPRWAVPPHEDLCRFLVSVRLLGLQLATQGAAFPAARLDRYERLFLRGYFGDDAVPVEQLRLYQLLVVLDKWSASVDRGRRGVRGRWHDRYFHHEAVRLLDQLQGSALSRPGRDR